MVLKNSVETIVGATRKLLRKVDQLMNIQNINKKMNYIVEKVLEFFQKKQIRGIQSSSWKRHLNSNNLVIQSSNLIRSLAHAQFHHEEQKEIFIERPKFLNKFLVKKPDKTKDCSEYLLFDAYYRKREKELMDREMMIEIDLDQTEEKIEFFRIIFLTIVFILNFGLLFVLMLSYSLNSAIQFSTDVTIYAVDNVSDFLIDSEEIINSIMQQQMQQFTTLIKPLEELLFDGRECQTESIFSQVNSLSS